MKQTTRYPWHLAPEWATHAATEKNGCGYWYGLHFTPDGWRHKWQQIGGVFYGTDYANSLETRPTEPQSEPLTICEAMQRNTEAAARLLEAPSYQEQLRAEFALEFAKSVITHDSAVKQYSDPLSATSRTNPPSPIFVSKRAIEYADALLNQLYPSPQNTTEHGK